VSTALVPVRFFAEHVRENPSETEKPNQKGRKTSEEQSKGSTRGYLEG
jgi:hypothetical protein